MPSWMVEWGLQRLGMSADGRASAESQRAMVESVELVDDNGIEWTAEVLGRAGILRPEDTRRARLAARQRGPGIDAQGRPTWDGRPCCFVSVKAALDEMRDGKPTPFRSTCPVCRRVFEIGWKIKAGPFAG